MNSECFLIKSLRRLSSKNLLLVLLELQDDLGSSLHLLGAVWIDGESTTSVGLPSVLLVGVILGDDSDLFGDQVSGVETHTELTDHADVCSGGDGLHETSGTGLGDGSEVVDELTLGHTNTSIEDGQGVVRLVWDDLHFEIWFGLELLWLGDGAH